VDDGQAIDVVVISCPGPFDYQLDELKDQGHISFIKL